MQPQKAHLLRQVLWIHAAIGGGALLLWGLIRADLFFCPAPLLLHLYCPGCGGTRALLSLLRGDVGAALLLHPGAVFLALCTLYYEGRLLAFFCARRPRPLRLRMQIPLAIFLALSLGYCALRNLALVYWGVDPIGDLLPLWHPAA